MSPLISQSLIVLHVAPLMSVARTLWNKLNLPAVRTHFRVWASSLCLFASRLAFGNCNGLAVVDYLQKTVILCMSTLDLYGATDPYQRLTRSPRRNRQSTSGSTHTNTYREPALRRCTYCTEHLHMIRCQMFSYHIQTTPLSTNFLSSLVCFFF